MLRIADPGVNRASTATVVRVPEPAADATVTRRGPYRRTSSRRESILDAAVEVFSRGGYRSSPLREIAALAGVSEGGLLHHFPTKATLLAAVLEHRDALGRELLGASDAGGETVLDGLVELARHNQSSPGLAQLHVTLSLEATDPDHPAHAHFTQRHVTAHALVANALADLAARGRLRAGVTPEDGAVLILAAMDGLQLQWLQAPDRIDMPRLLRLAIDGVVGPPAP